MHMHPGAPGSKRILKDDGSRTHEGAKTETSFLGKPGRKTCDACKAGDHSAKHGKIGCLSFVGEYVCQCRVPGGAR